RQGLAQLFFRQQFLLHQNLTEPDFLWPCHACSSTIFSNDARQRRAQVFYSRTCCFLKKIHSVA
ncbi:MAG: hypothetical protein RSD99_20865, partial [Janthinobacterium sp.]